MHLIEETGAVTGAAASAPGPRRLRVACVYTRESVADLVLSAMSYIRFYRMAEALARRGHEVDIVLERSAVPMALGPRLREIPFCVARWDRYDVAKTSFHRGFETLLAEGGADHPFIIAKLGSVVGREQTPGVHFYGAARERLFATQAEIARRARLVTVLTEQSALLWRREHGPDVPLLLVPTGVDAEIPPPRENPYRAIGIDGPVAIYAGNIYLASALQPEVNALWQERLNRVGRHLARRGLRLVVMGPGDTHLLDPEAVLHVGQIAAGEFWDWQRCAHVGLVLAQGTVQDNESSKIYYYLRTGLPVVCERPVPNASLVESTGHGEICDYLDDEALADAAARLAVRPPEVGDLIDRVVARHSWDARAALYDPFLAGP